MNLKGELAPRSTSRGARRLWHFWTLRQLNVRKFPGTQPAGCSFWKLAADGGVFYTVPENRYNCAVGAYTHNTAIVVCPMRC